VKFSKRRFFYLGKLWTCQFFAIFTQIYHANVAKLDAKRERRTAERTAVANGARTAQRAVAHVNGRGIAVHARARRTRAPLKALNTAYIQGSRDTVPCGVQRQSLCITSPSKKQNAVLRPHRRRRSITLR